MLSDARDEALDRMAKQAKEKGVNTVVSVRFTTSDVMQGAAEILVFWNCCCFIKDNYRKI